MQINLNNKSTIVSTEAASMINHINKKAGDSLTSTFHVRFSTFTCQPKSQEFLKVHHKRENFLKYPQFCNWKCSWRQFKKTLKMWELRNRRPCRHWVRISDEEGRWLGFSCRNQKGHKRANGGSPAPRPVRNENSNELDKDQKKKP